MNRDADAGREALASQGPGVPGGNALALIIAFWAAINAYSYAMVAAIPIVQSDTWRFLDDFLGRFIVDGFSWIDLFTEINTNGTNLPLQKLFLFFHTHFFGMDFRLEGILGVVSGIVLVLVVTRAATAIPMRRWEGPECWLLAGLMMVVLSLNSTMIYTWPLATGWFLPLLIAILYFWIVWACRVSSMFLVVASFVLGLLIDEVAFPVFAAAFTALLISRLPHGRKDVWRFMAFGGLGLLGARVFYQAVQHISTIKAESAEAKLSIGALLDPGIWQAVTIPLSDSVVDQGNQITLMGSGAPIFTIAMGSLLFCAHLWFWWRCIFIRRPDASGYPTATYMAMSIMLFFYALVLGILLQRIPVFGFSYLHQSRYVIFYQLNLVALSLLLYREYMSMETGNRLQALVRAAAVIGILAFGILQFRLSTLAWEHSKYVSTYVESASLSLGRLAVQPELELECVETLNICTYPVEKRRAIMNMLVRYRLNVFSPQFQEFHRLYPFVPGADANVPEKTSDKDSSP